MGVPTSRRRNQAPAGRDGTSSATHPGQDDHKQAGSATDAGSEAFTPCVFREPGQRILSIYYYWRANQADQAATVRCARENRLLAFLRSRDPLIVNCIDDPYVRRLTGLYATASADPVAPVGQTPDDSLALPAGGSASRRPCTRRR